MERHWGMRTRTTLPALLAALALFAAACGSDADDASTDAGGDVPAAGDSSGGETESSADDSAGEGATPADAVSIPFSISDDLLFEGVSISDDGTVAVVTTGQLSLEGATPVELIVFDVASQSESYRASVETFFNASDPIIADAGVSLILNNVESTDLVTFDASDTAGRSMATNGCWQYFKGTVDSAANVVYTVADGICRLDLVTGAETVVSPTDVMPDALQIDSVQYVDGRLIAVVNDENLSPVTFEIDPVTLLPISQVDVVIPDEVRLYGDLLDDQLNNSAQARIAISPNGSFVALVQGDRIDILTN